MDSYRKKPPEIKEPVISTYYPNRRYLFALPLFAAGCVWGLWACGIMIHNGQWTAIGSRMKILFFLAISVCCIICMKVLYDAAQQGLYCTEKGLYIRHDSHGKMGFVSWQDMKNAYETRNFQGHRYFVRSCEALSKEETRHLAAFSSWRMKMQENQSVMIWNNGCRNAQTFFSEVKQHVKVISYI